MQNTKYVREHFIQVTLCSSLLIGLAFIYQSKEESLQTSDLSAQSIVNNERYTIEYYPNNKIKSIKDSQLSISYNYYDDAYGSQPDRGRPQSILFADGSTREFAEYWGTTSTVRRTEFYQNGNHVLTKTYTSDAKPIITLSYFSSGNVEKTYYHDEKFITYHYDEDLPDQNSGRIMRKITSDGVRIEMQYKAGSTTPYKELHYSAESELVGTKFIHETTGLSVMLNIKNSFAAVTEPREGKATIVDIWKEVSQTKQSPYHAILFESPDTTLWGVPFSHKESFTNPSGELVQIEIEYPRIDATKQHYLLKTLQEGEQYAEANFAALNSALDYVRSEHIHELRVPRGEYHIAIPESNTSKHHILLRNQEDLVFNGQGSTFLFHNRADGFTVLNSERVIVKNTTLDWAKPLALPGKIERDTRSGHEGSYVFELINENAYSVDPANPLPIMAISGFDIVNKKPLEGDQQFHLSYAVDPNPDTYVTLLPKENPNEPYRYAIGMDHWTEGKKQHWQEILESMVGVTAVGMAKESYNGFQVRESSNVTLQNDIVYTAPRNAFTVKIDSENVHVTKSQVLRKPTDPTRMVSTVGGGSRQNANKGNIIYSENRFRDMMDDATNFHGNYRAVISKEDDRTYLIVMDATLDIGDRFAFYHPDTHEKVGESVIESFITATPCSDPLGYCSRIVLQNALDNIEPGLFAMNESNISANFIVRDNFIYNNRAHAFVASSRNGLIENNYFAFNSIAAILLNADTALFLQGPLCEDIIIANNTILNSGYGTVEEMRTTEHGGFNGAITLNTHSQTNRSFFTNSFHKNIEIVGNTIRNVAGYGIVIGSADNVVVKDNAISRIFRLSMPEDFTEEDGIKVIGSGTIQKFDNTFE